MLLFVIPLSVVVVHRRFVFSVDIPDFVASLKEVVELVCYVQHRSDQ